MVPEVMSWYTAVFLWLPLIFFASSTHMVRTDINNGDPGFQKMRYLNGGDDVQNDDVDSSRTTTYNNTVVNMTVQLGVNAYLHCHARTAGENSAATVSWLRRRDFHILSSGMFTYTNDERFQIMHPEGSEDWTLQIKFVQKRDNGLYECQVSTSTSLVTHLVNLQIVVPKAFIQGLAERHVDVGTVISLVCIIEQSPTPPQYVFWYHNDRMINYDTARSGITVETLPGAPTHSRLTIRDTQDTDTGNYTCSASNTEPASIYVFVEEGDKMASLRKKSNATKRLGQMKYFTLLSIICSYISL